MESKKKCKRRCVVWIISLTLLLNPMPMPQHILKPQIRWEPGAISQITTRSTAPSDFQCHIHIVYFRLKKGSTGQPLVCESLFRGLHILHINKQPPVLIFTFLQLVKPYRSST